MFSTATVSPLELHLDEKNPRFKININPSQDDIRNYMLINENVLHLAVKMVNMNSLLPGERVIVFEENGNKIVLEGNRRTCIHQMLLDRTLIPQAYVNSFPVAREQLLSEIENVSVDVVNSREEAMAYLAARHLEGVKEWSSISKWRISYELSNQGKTIQEIADYLIIKPSQIKSYICNYKLLIRGIFKPNWSIEEKRIINPLNIKPDKLIRIFHLTETTQSLGLYFDANYNLKSTFIPEENIDKIIEILTKRAFINNTLNTRSTFADILNDILPLMTITENARDNQNGNGVQFGDIQNNAGVNTNVIHGTETSNRQYDNTPISNRQEENTTSTTTSEASENTTNEQEGTNTIVRGTGGTANLPYFFDGISFGHLSSNDQDTHGIIRICNEVKLFSSRRQVNNYPIAAAFLTRALIEHALIYYSKKHNIQGQNKLIWEQVEENGTTPKLSRIIEKYIRNLPNYISDNQIREYFSSLFTNYNGMANPLNWVIHRPQDYVLSPNNLITLPAQGLLSIINFLIS